MKNKSFQKRYFVILLASSVLLHFSCTRGVVRSDNSVHKIQNHPNLRRFNNPHINQIIITAWGNFQKRNYESAALDFERLVKKHYIDYDILFGAGISFFHYNNRKKAIRYTTRAISLNPDHFEALYLRAVMRLRMNDRVSGEKDLKMILQLRCSRPLICGYYSNENDIADHTMLLKRRAEARKLLKR